MNHHSIIAALSLLASGSLTTGCNKDRPATEVPAAANTQVVADEGEGVATEPHLADDVGASPQEAAPVVAEAEELPVAVPRARARARACREARARREARDPTEEEAASSVASVQGGGEVWRGNLRLIRLPPPRCTSRRSGGCAPRARASGS